jgi:hypothetical protein
MELTFGKLSFYGTKRNEVASVSVIKPIEYIKFRHFSHFIILDIL